MHYLLSIYIYYLCICWYAPNPAWNIHAWNIHAWNIHAWNSGRFEVLSGFANSVFLVFVALLIVLESVERMMDLPDMSTDHLLLVSVVGLMVNILGLLSFHEAHLHGNKPNASKVLSRATYIVRNRSYRQGIDLLVDVLEGSPTCQYWQSRAREPQDPFRGYGTLLLLLLLLCLL